MVTPGRTWPSCVRHSLTLRVESRSRIQSPTPPTPILMHTQIVFFLLPKPMSSVCPRESRVPFYPIAAVLFLPNAWIRAFSRTEHRDSNHGELCPRGLFLDDTFSSTPPGALRMTRPSTLGLYPGLGRLRTQWRTTLATVSFISSMANF